MELKDALVKLAWARLEKEAYKAAADVSWNDLMQTPQGKLWQEMQEKSGAAGKLVAEQEEQAREVALAAFRETGIKNPEAGVAIKLFRRVKYDAEQALAWCETHAPIFVKRVLDAKAFEAAAEGMIYSTVPCTIEYEPRPQIATDLSDYLAPEPDAELNADAEVSQAAAEAEAARAEFDQAHAESVPAEAPWITTRDGTEIDVSAEAAPEDGVRGW